MFKSSARLAMAVWVAAGAVTAAAPQNLEFDRSRPLAVADRDVSVREISYAGPAGERTEATLIAPAAPGKHPGVLFVHWYGPEHTTSNRTQYVPDALALARQGIVSLLADTPWSEPTWFRTRRPEDDVQFSTDEVKRLSRAVDVLASLANVDPGRLALVGHDFGAMYGAIVAARDPRISAFAFIAGTSKFADWFTLGRKLQPDDTARVYRELEPFDPIAHLPKVTAKAVLLQFASKDPYVTADAANALVAAVKAPKESKFYQAGHDMNREAMDDRVAWLARVFSGWARGVAAP